MTLCLPFGCAPHSVEYTHPLTMGIPETTPFLFASDHDATDACVVVNMTAPATSCRGRTTTAAPLQLEALLHVVR
jgi:hypothetical protein